MLPRPEDLKFYIFTLTFGVEFFRRPLYHLYISNYYPFWRIASHSLNFEICVQSNFHCESLRVVPIKADCILGLIEKIEEQSLLKEKALWEIGWIDYCSDLVQLDHLFNLFTNTVSCDQIMFDTKMMLKPSNFQIEKIFCILNMEGDTGARDQ